MEGFSISEFLLSLIEDIQLSSRTRPFSLLPEQNTDVRNVCLSKFFQNKVFLFVEMHILEINLDFSVHFIFHYIFNVLI